MQTEFISSTDPAYFLIVGLAAAYACLALIVLISWMSSRSTNQKRDSRRSVARSSIARNSMERTEITALRSELAKWMDSSNAATTRMRQMKFEMDQLRGRLEELEQNFDEHVAIPHAEISMFQPVDDDQNTLAMTKPDPVYPGTEGLRSEKDSELGLIYLDRPEVADDLTQIWGIGAVNQTRLQENGVFFFHQIASWTPQVIAKFDEVLMFKGRIARETWVEQAERFAQKQIQEAA